MRKLFVITLLFLSPLFLNAQEITTSTPEGESAIEEGKELAEKFVVEPAKKAGEVVVDNTAPIIDRITRLLEDKKENVEKEIVEDKKRKEILDNATSTSEKRFSERFRDEMPPILRLLYSLLLSLLILIFNIWWLLALVVLVLIRVAWKLFRRWRDGY